jgi:hypothetical protein
MIRRSAPARRVAGAATPDWIFIHSLSVVRSNGSYHANHHVGNWEAGMHDIVIRGGTIVDGTGRAAFTGDVAIADGRIAGVGGKQGPARREIDATGDGYARLGRRAHALRRAGDVGPAARSLMLAWRDNRYVRKLWRGLCTGEKASSSGPDGFDGRRRGNSEPRPNRRAYLGVGELSRFHECPGDECNTFITSGWPPLRVPSFMMATRGRVA